MDTEGYLKSRRRLKILDTTSPIVYLLFVILILLGAAYISLMYPGELTHYLVS